MTQEVNYDFFSISLGLLACMNNTESLKTKGFAFVTPEAASASSHH